MRLLLHITGAKIKRNFKKNIMQSAAVFISVFMISFFFSFAFGMYSFMEAYPTFGITATSPMQDVVVENIRAFLNNIVNNIIAISVLAGLLSFVTVYIYSRIRAEENKQFFATLSSIGATHLQKTAVSVFETLALYAVPIIAGAFLGILPANICTALLSGFFVKDAALPPLLPIAALVSVAAVLLVLVFNLTRRVGRRGSVIQNVRRHNEKEAGQTHGYRRSFTFQNMPIEQRIAKKSVEYYSEAYRRIMVMFTVCALYPALAVLFFYMLSNVKLESYAADTGIDVGALMNAFAGYISLFVLIAFLFLFAFAIFDVIYMIKAQNRVRMDTLVTYKSIGMTDQSIKKVQKYEYRTVALNAFVCFIFTAVILLHAILFFMNLYH